MFSVIGWIIFGLIVGAIAKLVMPGRDPGGWVVTILLGIAGALIGGWLGRAAGWYGPNEGAGYDLGAYEFFSGTATRPNPPTNVRAAVH